MTAADPRQAASEADAAILAERRRVAALRLARSVAACPEDDSTTPHATPPQPSTTTAATPAPAQERPDIDDSPLYEVTVSAFGGDVDGAGERLVAWPDRVELVDGKGRLRSSVAIDSIVDVRTRKRVTSSTVTIVRSDRQRLVVKGVRPAAAERFRDVVAIVKLGLSSRSNDDDSAELLRRLDDLAARGLLSERELAEKRLLLARRNLADGD